MKISYNWLRDYLNFDKTPQETANILTHTGLEVENIESFESIKGGLEGVVIGLVKSVEPHPNADKLKITRVDTGTGSTLQIICGAPNVAAGQKVVVALPGARLWLEEDKPLQIKKTKIRGVVSEGMICAEDEIGIGNDHSGIMVLPGDVPIGIPAAEYFDIYRDSVFEIGLTPNRSDALGHVGVDRDIAAVLSLEQRKKLRVQLPQVDTFKVDNHNLPISVEVLAPDACPRYSGLTISGVTVGPSPAWLQNRLKAVGVRPLNNIVDVTNYVLQELGQPLHAFDADAIKGGKVIVKAVEKGTPFITLDDEKRLLSDEDLMICNAEEPMCIAGVFGGKSSGIKSSTRNIFLESACFNPVYIRKTANRHQLRTDAAIRFEKGTDPEITIFALKRAALMIKTIAGGEISSEIIDIYPNPIPRKIVHLRISRLHLIAGVDIPLEDIELILHGLEIIILEKTNEGLTLEIPLFRNDVTREIDVIEEILRIYGMNRIPEPKMFKASLVPREKPDKEYYVNKTARYLTGLGFAETMTNPITDSNRFKAESDRIIQLLQSANSGLDALRPDMSLSMLDAIRYNLNRQLLDLKFYEFGKIYFKENSNYIEKDQLALAVTGNVYPESWRIKTTPADFFYLKAVVENIFQLNGITVTRAEAFDNEKFDYGLMYTTADGKPLGYVGKCKPSFLNQSEIRQAVCFASLEWEPVIALSGSARVRFKEIPRFPAIRRDIALLIDKNVTFETITRIVLQNAGSLLEKINLFDVYQHPKLGENKKSYAISLTFRDRNKTLTDKQVDKVMKAIVTQLNKELNASIR